MPEVLGKRQEGRVNGGCDSFLQCDTAAETVPAQSSSATAFADAEHAAATTAGAHEFVPQPAILDVSTSDYLCPNDDTSYTTDRILKSNMSSASINPDPSTESTSNSQQTIISELSQIIERSRKNPAEYWKSVRLSKKIVRAASISEVSGSDDLRPHAEVSINGHKLTGLMDTGASISCLGKEALQTLHQCKMKWKEYSGGRIHTASGHSQEIIGFVDTEIEFRGEIKKIRLFIIPSLTNKLYLGVDFWIKSNILPKIEEVDHHIEEELDKANPDMHQLDENQRSRMAAIVKLYPSSTAEGLGKTSIFKHTIDVGDTKPIKQRHYPVSPAIEQKLFEEVDRMLQLGVVRESTSAWSSPVTVVAKGNGKTRLCLDARKVNVKDAYPMPMIDSIISRLNETHYISSIDLKDAFWQIELDEESCEKTAFTIPGRPLYEFARMPFGLCNAAQSMCRLMDLAIPAQHRGYVFVYIDDLLIVSTNFETHLERLQLVANCLRRANLTINVDKSRFCMMSIKYLGHIVGGGTIKPDPGRVKCISECPVPKTTKQLRRFLGMAGWYQRYIKNYSTISAPLTDLLKKADRFMWTPEAEQSFATLKTSLTTAPVLTHPDFAKPFFYTMRCFDDWCGRCVVPIG